MWINFTCWLKESKDWIIPIANIILATVAIFALYFNIQSDRRAVKVFESQIRPVVQAKPVDFKLVMGGKDGKELMGITTIQYVNYGILTAYNVRTDVKYSGTNVWINDWIPAALKGLEEKQQKEELTEQEKAWLSHYKEVIKVSLDDLKPGRENYKAQEWAGAWGPREGEKTISIRLRWKDAKGFEFDYIDDYRLIINKAFDSESFTIVPIDSPKK